MVNEVVESHEVPGSNPRGDKNTCDSFLVDKVTWYLLLVGNGSYFVELVEMTESWPRHHGH